MQTIYRVVLGLHILLGAVGLVSFWLPALTRKGGKLHRKAGWFYVWAMLGMVVTAGLLSLMLMTLPLAIHPVKAGLTVAQIARHATQTRAGGAFFGYISLLTFTAGWTGLRVLRAKKGISGMRTPFNIGLNVVNVVAGLGGIYMGLQMGQPLFVIFGAIAFGPALVFLNRLRRNREAKMYWWMEHISGMFTTGMAAYTGFFVNGGSRLLSALFAHAPGLQYIPWIAPTLIGTFCIIYLRRVYRRKFAGASAPAQAVAVVPSSAETLTALPAEPLAAPV